MNKKGLENVAIWLIAGAALLVVVIIILMNFGKFFSGQSNAEIIHSWVLARGAEASLDILPSADIANVVSSTPPVKDLAEPLKINKPDELLPQGGKSPTVFKDLADSMADCWSAFDKGNTDFLSAWDLKVFCFPCRTIVFDDSIKRNPVLINDFGDYLYETHTGGPDSKTYLQYLLNNKAQTQQELDALSEEKNAYNVLPSSIDLYITFVAFSAHQIPGTEVGNEFYSKVRILAAEDFNTICNL